MTREVLSASLTALASEIDSIAKRDRYLLFMGPSAAEIHNIDNDDGATENERGIADLLRSERASVVRERKNLKGLRARLEKIGTALAEDKVAWQSERSTYESALRVLGSLKRPAAPAAIQPSPEKSCSVAARIGNFAA